MANRIKFGDEAREALRAGAEKIYKAVSSTLGARGRNVVRQNFGRPKVTNDGVSVARAIELEDPFEREGADLLKEAAEKTNTEAGDGTTTSIVLAYTMLEKGLELIKAGLNPMVLRRQIEGEVERVQEALKGVKVDVTTHEELERVASISIENEEYGKVVADAIRATGKDGIVVIEEGGKNMGITIEEVHGYRFERGLEHPYLVTNPDKMEANLKADEGMDIPILIADKSWNLVGDLMPLFKELKEAGNDKLLIIAEEVSGELMAFLIKNRLAQRFHAAVVKTPFNKDMLEDIAALTGGTVVSSAKGIVNVKMSQLGKAKQVIVTRETTTIVDAGGDATELIASLRTQIETTEEVYEKGKLQERLAKLTGKTVMLRVGAATEAEARYLKDKLDDAVSATKAAVEEGVVAGGGMALARIAHALYKDVFVVSEGEDKKLEVKPTAQGLMFMVLTAPLSKIISNSGLNAEKIWPELFVSETSGFDALAGEVVEDIVAKGIIDPAKVERVALKHAASLACILLTCDTAIAEIPEKEVQQ